jgi:hypothetical protein
MALLEVLEGDPVLQLCDEDDGRHVSVLHLDPFCNPSRGGAGHQHDLNILVNKSRDTGRVNGPADIRPELQHARSVDRLSITVLRYPGLHDNAQKRPGSGSLTSSWLERRRVLGEGGPAGLWGHFAILDASVRS